MYKKIIFHSHVKTYKLLIISQTSCSDELFIKHLILKKELERKNYYYSLKESVLFPFSDSFKLESAMDFFIFFFIILETTRYVRYSSYRQRKRDPMKVKSKLYLQIRIKSLFNYMMEKTLFVNVE